MIALIIRKVTSVGLAGVLGLVLVSSVLAKEVTGEVSGIADDSISIIYKEEKAAGVEYEILLPIDQGTKVERIKDLNQIKVGDTVTVEYADTVETDAEGKEITKRISKVIKFVRPAPQAAPEVTPTEEGLVSGE